MTMQTHAPTRALLPAELHERVCLGCGHGSSLHRADPRGDCLLCEQVRSLWQQRASKCRGFAPDAT